MYPWGCPVADDLLHDCPGDCGLRIARNMLSCHSCWYRLPGNLRGRLNAAYPQRQKNPAAHRDALTGCLKWYRDNPPIREGGG